MARNDIAKKLLSEGSVSNILLSLQDEDSTIPLMRELALFIKRHRIPLTDLLVRLPFTEEIRKKSVQPAIIAAFIGNLYKEIGKKGLSPDEVHETIIGVSQFAQDRDIPLHRIKTEVSNKYSEFESVKSKIEMEQIILTGDIMMTDDALVNEGITRDELEKFTKWRDSFEQGLGLSFERGSLIWNLILNKDNGAVPGFLPAKVGGSHRIRRKRRRSGSDSNNTNEGIEDHETGEFKCITSSSEDSQLESGEQAEFKSRLPRQGINGGNGMLSIWNKLLIRGTELTKNRKNSPLFNQEQEVVPLSKAQTEGYLD